MREDKLVEPACEREADAVPGPFYVIKDRCILCAAPVNTAPGNITWSEETFRRGCDDCPTHCRVERQPGNDEELEAMIQAACVSCIEAIRYCGTDPQVLARFTELGYGKLCDALFRP